MLEQIQDVFREVFEDDALVVRRTTTAKDVPGWDSLTHVTLLVTIEGKFGIRFKSSEIDGLRDVGQLVDVVERLRGSQ